MTSSSEEFPVWNTKSPLLSPERMEAHPELASLWHELERTQFFVERDWLAARGLRALPLHEAWIDTPRPLFQTLREAGSKRGYLIETPLRTHDGRGFADPELYAFELNDKTAELIQGRSLFEGHWMFVDDKQQCILLIWYTDFSLLCMPPALFDRWAALEQPDFCAYDDTRAVGFHDLLTRAFRRFEDFPENLQFGNGPVFDNLAWQFD